MARILYGRSTHSNEVKEICKCLELSDIQLRDVMVRFEQAFQRGLNPATASNAAVKMLPTYIRAVAVGEERGEFLALDLGGTNFRVLLITLEGHGRSTMRSKIYRVPDHIQKGTGPALFDHIAACLAKFMQEHALIGRPKLPLGFTFSFPCEQHGLTSAMLSSWTKGFNASGVVGEDVVQLLRAACIRRGVDIDVVAVLNDTTGTMLACSFFEKYCYIGVIVGTGCNAAYMEKLENVPKLHGVSPIEDGLPPEMCLNTEWGGFGDDGALDEYLTMYDRKLDKHSINPGRQRFEKTISGMYLGELVRLVLEDLTRRGLLLSGDMERISDPGCFPTKLVSDIVGQTVNEDNEPFGRIEEKLQEIGISNSSPSDCANIAYVCSLVSARAAHFCACGIAALLNRMQRPNVTIGVDGSVYRFHPTFKHLLDAKINSLVDQQYKFILVLSEDGSGRGAAVNSNFASFFRVQYAHNMMNLLLEAVKKQELNVLDRFQLADDLYALVRSTRVPASHFLEFLNVCREEDDFFVWAAISSALGDIGYVLGHLEDGNALEDRYNRFVCSVIEPVAAKLGWEPREGEGMHASRLRAMLLGRLSRSKHRPTVETALSKFNAHVTEGVQLVPDLSRTIFVAAARSNDVQNVSALKHLMETANYSVVELNCIAALGQCTDTELLEKNFHYGVFDGKIRDQDLDLLFASAASAPKASSQQFVWNFFKQNVDLLLQKYGGVNTMLFQDCLKSVASGFCSSAMADEFEEFLEKKLDEHSLKTLDRPIRQVVESIKLNERLLKHTVGDLDCYLQKMGF
uniref:hexokinase n=1 Tax=Globodera pallida TaxID=36090 RepID=A0A183BRT7_GLOPA